MRQSIEASGGRKRRIKRYEFRLFIFVLGSFLAFPVLYLQHRLLSSQKTKSYNKDVSSKIHKSLNEFYAEKKRRRKDLNDKKQNLPERTRPLTAYLESSNTLNNDILPLPIRNSSASSLKKVVFPSVKSCSSLMQNFPVDEYPLEDAFLPWIHDYFPTHDGKSIQFVAQNRRRCDTGESHEQTMKFWEPQIALFQPIPIIVDATKDGSYRLASNLETATHNMTRFQCRFHTLDGSQSMITLSEFKFNYEYINWRKGKEQMFSETGKEMERYWLSQLLFTCPIPSEFQSLLHLDRADRPNMYLDLIPIRTPVRKDTVMLTTKHLGLAGMPPASFLFDGAKHFGDNHFLPHVEDSGRWSNLPVCRRDKTGPSFSLLETKPHRLVACTWTSASYSRRGDTVTVSDSVKRLEEWIHFHLLVGFDHLYIYDNSDRNSTNIRDAVRKFDTKDVTYHQWPCHLCNNNRPAHKNPGERSSQYAAEASCRERYGPLTEWMSFLDTDEYLVPMKADKKGEYNWNTILDDIEAKNLSILSFRSSRGVPRTNLMEVMEDQSTCVDPVRVRGPNQNKVEPCIGPMQGKTFLEVYNCEYIRPPKPSRFSRAMKQIYRPSYVYSHFVHYSTVTADLAQTYADFTNLHSDTSAFILNARSKKFEDQEPAIFLDELTQGQLVHARSILPHETKRRSAECYYKSKFKCMLGYLCEDDVDFVDEKHKDNIFQNSDGSYCNCWRNPVIDNVLVPLLMARMKTQGHG